MGLRVVVVGLRVVVVAARVVVVAARVVVVAARVVKVVSSLVSNNTSHRIATWLKATLVNKSEPVVFKPGHILTLEAYIVGNVKKLKSFVS